MHEEILGNSQISLGSAASAPNKRYWLCPCCPMYFRFSTGFVQHLISDHWWDQDASLSYLNR